MQYSPGGSVVEKNLSMARMILFPLLLINITMVYGQQTGATDTAARMASVDVTVTDLKNKPRKGEEVIFHGEKTGKNFSGFSNAGGKFRQLLPPGDDYLVSVKSISDTTKYTLLKVPALAEDEYFTEPFWVNIKMEPARSFRLDHVYFDVDKATLRRDSYNQLSELLAYLQRHEEMKAEIAGHTDNTGTDAHNLKLSQDRANAIRNYLVSKGIASQRLTAKGYGSSQPVADNATEEGRQLNRRTELRIQ